MKNEIQTGRNPDGYIIYIYIYAGGKPTVQNGSFKKMQGKNCIYIYKYIYITGAGKQQISA